MDHDVFRVWLSQIDDLTLDQRLSLAAALTDQTPKASVLSAIESSMAAGHPCPHCGSAFSVGRGQANGLQRFRCKACRKSFNALTGTPLAGLRKKERWLGFGRSPVEGETVATSATRCAIAPNTAFRWRHRFLRAAKIVIEPLQGIVEADETYVLSSRKGERRLDRKARKRGGKAAKPGLSDELVPVLVAVDRSGATVSAVLPAVPAVPAVTAEAAEAAEAVEAVLKPVVSKAALLVTDGNNIYPLCARALGISHEAINISAGKRVRGEIHIQTANSRHETIKTLLRRHRGIATKYLSSYINWAQIKAQGCSTLRIPYHVDQFIDACECRPVAVLA
jgi:transposase-like protein